MYSVYVVLCIGSRLFYLCCSVYSDYDILCVDGTKGLVELLVSLAASIKHLDRSNSNTENTSEEFRKDFEN